METVDILKTLISNLEKESDDLSSTKEVGYNIFNPPSPEQYTAALVLEGIARALARTIQQ